MNKAIRRIVVVGGGSAGWLTAGVIAAGHRAGRDAGIHVTLIESPDVPILGVGEGTWPTMRDTLRKLGVSETAFLRECDASFKQGSKFVNWAGDEPAGYYYHPFVLPHGYTEINLAAGWRSSHADVPFADLVSFQPHLCERGRAPKQPTTPEFAAVANYAYHLDAGKFAKFLRRHCVEQLGVSHVIDNVRGVHSEAGGDVASLTTEAHGELAGDLFIDCTGFAALLIGGHFKIPFISRREILFNDAALAIQVPYPGAARAIASQTIATAQTAGWIWDIGLPTRRGVGYVYSSSHISDDQAAAELAAYIRHTGGMEPGALGAPRKIAINPGHRETFWHRNCVAVGVAAGFIEPLEASALALIELSAAMISDQLPATRGVMDIVARRFNDRFRYRWDRVIDFLKLHYLLTRRRDSDYWIDNQRPETAPPRLRELLELWRYQPPSRYDLYQVEEIFPSASYQYVLYGMGFKPELEAPASAETARAEGAFQEVARLTAKMLAGLPTNRDLLDHIAEHPLQRL